MSATNYVLDKEIKHEFGLETYSVTGFWVGLSTSAIDKSGNGVVEPSGAAGYSRYSLPKGTGNWQYSDTGVVVNTSAATFNSTGNWGTVISVFLADASSGGNILYYYTLSPSIPVVANTTLQFAAGTLVAKRT